MRFLLQHGNGTDVERVPRRALERRDPPLAQDHLGVPFLDDVLGRHQQLLDRRRRAALQQDRLVRPADLGEQVEVLHVARADLDHVRVLEDSLDVAGIHQLGHDRQPGFLPRLDKDRQRLLPEAAERVRRRPRLERPAAQHRPAGLRDSTGRLERLLPVLDRARACDEPKRVVADSPAAHLDHGRIRRQLTRDELVRLENRHDLLDTRIALERQGGELVPLADRCDHGRLAPGRDVRVGPRLVQPGHDVLDLLGSRVCAHHDQQLWRSRHGHGTQDTFVRPMRIFSGIQPTGDKHLGNYIGAIRQWVDSQNDGETFICIVDLHSITVAYDPKDLRESTLSLAALLLASGIDPGRSTLFVQSHNRDHPDAAWLLASTTSYGELRRMTQFKDKSEHQEFISVGLFTYPVLQAADILLYNIDAVPVGEDQRQHVELTRDVAERFNSRYGETLVVPKVVTPKLGAKIMDLQEPTKKMSTTGSSAQGTVQMLDEPAAIRKKVKSAVTDSGREVRRGEGKDGIENLISIMAVATGQQPDAIESRYDGAGYGDFKSDVAESVVELLAPIQARYHELRSDPAELQRLLKVGAEKARAVSGPTLSKMYERMGFVTRP